jgi:hypothetical protein
MRIPPKSFQSLPPNREHPKCQDPAHSKRPDTRNSNIQPPRAANASMGKRTEKLVFCLNLFLFIAPLIL